ncbi:iron-containing alcohol dehydrogenase [Photobacterium sanguinicancri]|uniref:iron-containing alcohol dehydrogenase n=1 Tax=Photobacterium sanguinicancri TaxID=875932 RepID=UPI0021C362F5|nr:iron-containing alcohol dehydrogenase [Photobacterium sanguinicancri]
MKIDFPVSIDISDSESGTNDFESNLNQAIKGELFILCGPGFSHKIALNLIEKYNLKPNTIVIVNSNSLNEVATLEKTINSSVYTILGIGGGKVCDFSKRLSYLTQANLILYPTVVSNDGLISPISVLTDGDKTCSLPGKMPEHVFIDLDIIRSAPEKYIVAAALDLLSNISATSDWHHAAENGDSKLNFLAYQFSRIAAYQLLDCVSWEINAPEFLRAVIHGQILSAMAMAYAGSSRPCSGSEHLISHAFDELGISREILHGEKVGRATLFILFLQGKNTQKIKQLFEKFQINKTLLDGVMSDDLLLRVFNSARNTRPGRRTIMDNFSDKELLIKYRQFEIEI